jgi:hypothetical protein
MNSRFHLVSLDLQTMFLKMVVTKEKGCTTNGTPLETN